MKFTGFARRFVVIRVAISLDYPNIGVFSRENSDLEWAKMRSYLNKRTGVRS